MAIDLTGINNFNEYYTNYYLANLFEENIQDLLKKEREIEQETGLKATWKRLKSLSETYFIQRERFNREKDDAERLNIQTDFLIQILNALGYSLKNEIYYPTEDLKIPVMARINRANGSPELLIIQHAAFETDNPLESQLSPMLYEDEIPGEITDMTVEDIITKKIFATEEAPRWVILADMKQMILLDRQKWAEKRFISADIEEIYRRKEDTTFKALSCKKNPSSPKMAHPFWIALKKARIKMPQPFPKT